MVFALEKSFDFVQKPVVRKQHDHCADVFCNCRGEYPPASSAPFDGAANFSRHALAPKNRSPACSAAPPVARDPAQTINITFSCNVRRAIFGRWSVQLRFEDGQYNPVPARTLRSASGDTLTGMPSGLA
jgi:hypothetical protein